MTKLIVLRGITGAGKTTLGERLRTSLGDCVVLELDDVKRQRYGTTMRCEPPTDFPEFGRSVNRQLSDGKTVVAVEAFIDRQHLDWFLEGVGWSESDPRIRYVWLECSRQESVVRKADVLTEAQVAGQHGRLPGRHRIAGELTINTDDLRPDEVLGQVLAFVR